MSDEYHKIDSIFKRTPDGRRIIEGEYSRPEFELLKDINWTFTEKVDGTNIRLYFDAEFFSLNNIHANISGRTNNAQIPTFLLTKLVEIYRAADWQGAFPTFFELGEAAPPVTIYGEGYGAKIQKGGGKYISDGVDFVVFDIRIGQWWLKREDVEEIAGKLGMTTVPIIGEGTLDDAVEFVREGFASYRWPNVTDAEGLVVRPSVELLDRGGRRIITKIKHRDFQ